MRVTFICHGNICRSPVAEYVFADLVRKAGREEEFVVTSAAVTEEGCGGDVYPPARRTLLAHHVPCPPHRAHKITPKEIEETDVILCMDRYNIRLLNLISPLAAGKARLLGEYGLNGAEIDDPWYTGKFDLVYDEIALCCAAFLASTSEK